MSDEPERPQADLPQDPGIPGSKVPEEQPPRRRPHVKRVPDAGPSDTDDEGHMTPPVDQRSRSAKPARGVRNGVSSSRRPKPQTPTG